MYSKVVRKLNFRENHKTMTQYENSLIAKSYLFQFVNSFVTCFYIAFFKSFFEKDCKTSQCIMDDLQEQLSYIYVVAFVKNILELLIPYMKFKCNRRKQKKAAPQVKNKEKYVYQKGKSIQQALDKIYELPEYKTLGVDGTFGDYLELCIQFGFLTLFSVAFPLAAALSSVSNVAEMYTDRAKILKMVRRPQPQGARHIGI